MGLGLPASGGHFPHTRKTVAEVFAGVTERVRRAAAFDNVARVFPVSPLPNA